MAKIGTNKTIGQPKSGTMRVANATSSGFGIIYADEIIGHRRVDTFAELANIPNWALYDQAGGADISTAKGQLWYVSNNTVDTDGKTITHHAGLYQLTNIDASGANRTWTEFSDVKLKSNTTQKIDAQPVTETANRTYAVQKNSDNQLVVNVPWTEGRNDNTTYTFANGTDGSFTVTPSGGTEQKVSIGTPANANHANMANSAGSATNDAQGHSIHLTYATKTEMAGGLNALDGKISALTSALVYKGTVNKSSDLPTTNVKVGDVYVVATAGMYAGQICENGDMIIAKVSGNTPEWTIVQTNIDGAITIKPNEKLTKDCIVIGASNESDTSVIGLAPSAGYLYWDGTKYVWKTPAEFNLKHATNDALGGIKIGYTAPASKNRQYAVQLSADDKAFVEVPWTNIPPVAANNALGGIKTGYAESGKNYAVKVDTDNKAYVTVDWTDHNTKYTGGTGIDITQNGDAGTVTLNEKLQKHLGDALNTENFEGYVTRVSKGTGSNGSEDQNWLIYQCPIGGPIHDIVQIFDSYSENADGLASIKSVGAVAANL